MFLLVKDIRNFQISLRSELCILMFLLRIQRGSSPRQNLALYTKA